MTALYYDYCETSIGRLLLAGTDEALTCLGFDSGKMSQRHARDWIHRPQRFTEERRQLLSYFRGQRRVFDLPLAPAGTPFQQQVWQFLRGIPYGETISYGEVAREIGRPAASRAVGAANGRNPIPVIIPCHRVIGSNGSLVGFGGGLPTKVKLLNLERQVRQPELTLQATFETADVFD